MGDLIWALAFFIPFMTVVLGLLPQARRALAQWGDSYGRSAAEREASAAKTLAGTEEARHELAVRRGALAEETEAEKARLKAETAQYETDAEAARKCLPDAVEARSRALSARAEAEAALAPEAARKALEGTGAEEMAALSEAYAAYCNAALGTPWSFGQWVGSFRGLGG